MLSESPSSCSQRCSDLDLIAFLNDHEATTPRPSPPTQPKVGKGKDGEDGESTPKPLAQNPLSLKASVQLKVPVQAAAATKRRQGRGDLNDTETTAPVPMVATFTCASKATANTAAAANEVPPDTKHTPPVVGLSPVTDFSHISSEFRCSPTSPQLSPNVACDGLPSPLDVLVSSAVEAAVEIFPRASVPILVEWHSIVFVRFAE